MATRFEITLTEEGSFRFQLRAGSGDLLLRGATSSSKIMTQNRILHLRSALRDPARFEAHRNVDGSSFVIVRDNDGSALARSRPATDEATRRELELTLTAAAEAPMIDLTKHHRAGERNAS